MDTYCYCEPTYGIHVSSQCSMDASSTPHRHPVLGGSPIPLYLQLADVLRQRISRGVWPAGTMLPSIESLMTEFSVSRVTVRCGRRSSCSAPKNWCRRSAVGVPPSTTFPVYTDSYGSLRRWPIWWRCTAVTNPYSLTWSSPMLVPSCRKETARRTPAIFTYAACMPMMVSSTD